MHVQHRQPAMITAWRRDIVSLLAAVQNTVGIPVAQMDDAYSQETLKLAEVVDRYASMDVYDAERPKLVGVSSLQTDFLSDCRFMPGQCLVFIPDNYTQPALAEWAGSGWTHARHPEAAQHFVGCLACSS